MLGSRLELVFLEVEDVAFRHGHHCLLILLAEPLQLALDCNLNAVDELGSFVDGGLAPLINHLAALLPHVEPFRVWQPFKFADKLVGQTIELPLVSLLPQEHFEVVLADRAVSTALRRLLNVQPCGFLLVGTCPTCVHLLHLPGIAGLVLNLSGWTRAVSLLGPCVLVVGQQSLQALVAHVALLLEEADGLVHLAVQLVEIGRRHGGVGPPKQQLVLFVLQLRGAPQIKAAQILARHLRV